MTSSSIRRHTTTPVDIVHAYPKREEGCTGFTNVRYKVRRGIYLDCDMILLADIAELWSYRQPGKFVCLQDETTEVAVIDCDHDCRNKFEERLLPMAATIPLAWNCEDRLIPGAKLLHFTGLKTQPWFYDHPDADAVEVYHDYRRHAGL